MLSIVRHFKDVPNLRWDLINKPSFSDPRAAVAQEHAEQRSDRNCCVAGWLRSNA